MSQPFREKADAQNSSRTGIALLRGFDLDVPQAMKALSEWNSRCQPPWDEPELEKELVGFEGYGTERIGGRLSIGSQPMRVEDFYAYMRTTEYICIPDGNFWPGSRVDSRVSKVRMGTKSDGSPLLVKATAWLNQNRAVENITWAPGHPPLLEDMAVIQGTGAWGKLSGFRLYNQYRVPNIPRGDASKATRWLEHIEFLFPDDWEHVLNWFAHRVQRPHEKVNHALLLGGDPGIGKDTIIVPLRMAVGPWNFHEVTPTELMGAFTPFYKSVVLRVSEARDLGDTNRYALYEHMKPLLASPPEMLRVNEKNTKEYHVPNVVGVIITTNHKHGGIYLPPDDRRHYVAWSEKAKSEFPAAYFDDLYDWYERDGNSHVAAYLHERDISSFNPNASPPHTAAFREMVNSNRPAEESDLGDALEALGFPPALLLEDLALGPIQKAGNTELVVWLQDKRNSRKIPAMLGRLGYDTVPNPNASNGKWTQRIGDKNRKVTFYGRRDLSRTERIAFVQKRLGAVVERA